MTARMIRGFMNKKRIAREWLYFLGGMVFGFIVLPVFLSIVFHLFSLNFGLSSFYFALVEDRPALPLAWLLVLGPYLLFQLVRSVIWAYKSSR
jgi:hypothetical protein